MFSITAPHILEFCHEFYKKKLLEIRFTKNKGHQTKAIYYTLLKDTKLKKFIKNY